jgi:hypothetical protein
MMAFEQWMKCLQHNRSPHLVIDSAIVVSALKGNGISTNVHPDLHIQASKHPRN